MEFKIISATDWQKLRDIRLKAMESDPSAFGGDLIEEQTREEDEWKKRLENKNRFYFAAEENGVFVSLAGAKEIGEKIWMISAVYTRPTYRGRGLATKLTTLVVEECKQRGVVRVELMVNIDQKDAVKIYTNLGFSQVRIVPDQKMADGKLHDEYLMEKFLL
jgi:ribosomal protein S18 acetylase RimI-like enzyme